METAKAAAPAFEEDDEAEAEAEPEAEAEALAEPEAEALAEPEAEPVAEAEAGLDKPSVVKVTALVISPETVVVVEVK
ncbi:unnamed protein product [[Candida] boidinii]|nr:unnamed protein product [[Candida] boidinii]